MAAAKGNRVARLTPSIAKAVTPADGADLPDGPCTGLSITTAGAYSVVMAADATNTAVLVYLAAGLNDIAVKRVRATGSVSTSGITALYS